MAHIPVLLHECLSALSPQSGEFFVDGTLGGGGHAIEVIERLQPGGVFLGIDKDPDAVSNFQSQISEHYYALDKILIERESYSSLPAIIAKQGLDLVDGILLDLGFSSEQIKGGKLAGRGFSFSVNEPLLMTYNPTDLPLREILPTLSSEELAQIISDYGQERYSNSIANSIASDAREGKINTSFDLVESITRAVPKNYQRQRLNPATRTFQALRIYINQELIQLEELLKLLPSVMNKGGRVVIISFHSLEDRIVKNYFRSFSHKDSAIATLLNKKPITATIEEVNQNPRSRSAKLRAIKFN